MAKHNITQEKIKLILQEHKTPGINEAIEKWAEKILTAIVYQLQEEAKEREENLATKEDIKLLLDKMDKRFEAMQKQMDDRFEMLIKEMNWRFQNIEVRFEAMQKETNARFEAMQKEMNARFEAMQKETNARFEAMQKETNARIEAMQKETNARFMAIDAKFESLEKRLNTITWVIGIGFTILALINIWSKH